MSCADLPSDTLFVTVDTVVDDWYREVGWQLVRSRPGVKPHFSDSAVLTVDVVRELDGQTRERRW
jgi:hypothetical protein